MPMERPTRQTLTTTVYGRSVARADVAQGAARVATSVCELVLPRGQSPQQASRSAFYHLEGALRRFEFCWRVSVALARSARALVFSRTTADDHALIPFTSPAASERAIADTRTGASTEKNRDARSLAGRRCEVHHTRCERDRRPTLGAQKLLSRRTRRGPILLATSARSWPTFGAPLPRHPRAGRPRAGRRAAADDAPRRRRRAL